MSVKENIYLSELEFVRINNYLIWGQKCCVKLTWCFSLSQMWTIIRSFKENNYAQLFLWPILTNSNSDNFQFWQFPILTNSDSDNFQFWQFPTLTISNSDNFRFWQFPTSSKSGKKWILTNSDLPKYDKSRKHSSMSGPSDLLPHSNWVREVGGSPERGGCRWQGGGNSVERSCRHGSCQGPSNVPKKSCTSCPSKRDR